MDVGSRLATIAFVFVLAAAAVVVRLCRLQFTQHDFWEQEAVRARTRAVSLAFRRGSILDARGRPLATTRATFDLGFALGPFRKGTATGQLLLAHYLLTGERVEVASLLADPSPFIEACAGLTVEEVRSLEPGARRADLLVYLAWLAGASGSRELVERLRREPDEAPCCRELAGARDAIAERVRSEARALAAIARALDLPADELIGRIDRTIRALDARVVRRLAGRDRAGRLFECERELHKELDYEVVALARNVPHRTALDLAADRDLLAGLEVSEQWRRVYPPSNDVCPLVVGRVGMPDAEDLRAFDDRRDERDELALEPFPSIEQSQRLRELEDLLRTSAVQPDEEIGRDGLEASFEGALRGRRGFQRTVNDRAGGVREVVERVAPDPGLDLTLTLDADLQRAASAALARGVPESREGPRRRYAGAVVLIELPGMEVRVLASSPDPGRAEISRDWKRLSEDVQTRPLHPRAWRPWLPPPPGSSIKPIVAALALTAGVIGPESELLCDRDGLFAPGDPKPLRCESLHGPIEVRRALAKSCNHFFARVAQSAGSERMVAWLREVGLGGRTGFTGARLADGRVFPALPGEAAGTAEREAGARNLMLLGMGQGRLDVTPLQMAAAIGALATRRVLPPTLIGSVGGETPRRPEPVELSVSESAWSIVCAAMRAVTAPGGTAGPDHLADLTAFDLATKTGTPEQWGARREDHSWFVGWFPSRAPRFAFAIFLERTARHGGDAAAPLLLDLLEDPAFAEAAALARGVRSRGSPTPGGGP